MVTIGICVAVAMGVPVLFSQERPGLHGKSFRLVKFRTMSVPATGADPVKSDARRLTRLGRILRATSLDELPTFWNVLWGDMSLVGPRPLLMRYLTLYSPEQARRHEVRPGITGWAQVNGRNAISWEEKLDLDVWYVDNRSLFLDLRILTMTTLLVLRRQGVGHGGDALMPEFHGTEAGTTATSDQGGRA